MPMFNSVVSNMRCQSITKTLEQFIRQYLGAQVFEKTLYRIEIDPLSLIEEIYTLAESHGWVYWSEAPHLPVTRRPMPGNCAMPIDGAYVRHQLKRENNSKAVDHVFRQAGIGFLANSFLSALKNNGETLHETAYPEIHWYKNTFRRLSDSYVSNGLANLKSLRKLNDFDRLNAFCKDKLLSHSSAFFCTRLLDPTGFAVVGRATIPEAVTIPPLSCYENIFKNGMLLPSQVFGETPKNVVPISRTRGYRYSGGRYQSIAKCADDHLTITVYPGKEYGGQAAEVLAELPDEILEELFRLTKLVCASQLRFKAGNRTYFVDTYPSTRSARLEQVITLFSTQIAA